MKSTTKKIFIAGSILAVGGVLFATRKSIAKGIKSMSRSNNGSTPRIIIQGDNVSKENTGKDVISKIKFGDPQNTEIIAPVIKPSPALEEQSKVSPIIKPSPVQKAQVKTSKTLKENELIKNSILNPIKLGDPQTKEVIKFSDGISNKIKFGDPQGGSPIVTTSPIKNNSLNSKQLLLDNLLKRSANSIPVKSTSSSLISRPSTVKTLPATRFLV